jgi:hypothetical protein
VDRSQRRNVILATCSGAAQSPRIDHRRCDPQAKHLFIVADLLQKP